MVDGAQVTERFAEKIKADKYTEEASEFANESDEFINNKYAVEAAV